MNHEEEINDNHQDQQNTPNVEEENNINNNNDNNYNNNQINDNIENNNNNDNDDQINNDNNDAKFANALLPQEGITSDDEVNREIFKALESDNLKMISEFMQYRDLTDFTMHNSSIAPEVMRGHPNTLCVAAFNGSVESFRYLLNNGANVFQTDDEGRSCAHFAAASGNMEILLILQESGVEFTESLDKEENTPLFYAAAYGKLDIVKWFWSNGLSIDTTNSLGWYPLHTASAHNQVSVVSFLLDNMETQKQESIEFKTKNLFTPLMIASMSGSCDCIDYLIENGASLDAVDENNANSLIISCQNNMLKSAQTLIKHKININYVNSLGWGALHTAIRAKSFDLVFLLVHNGANVDQLDIYDMMPIHWASKFGLAEVVQILIQFHSGVNSKSKEGWSPLCLAAGYGSLECVKILVENDADINIIDKSGINPFMFACLNGHVEIAKYLHSKNADSSVTDKGGWNVLHWACANGHVEMVEYLLSIGIDPTIKNNDRQTPYDLAKQYKFDNVTRFMEDHGAAPQSFCIIA